jgi:hypothetical protein
MLMILFTLVAFLSARAALIGWRLGDRKGSAVLSANSAASFAISREVERAFVCLG